MPAVPAGAWRGRARGGRQYLEDLLLLIDLSLPALEGRVSLRVDCPRI